MMAGRSPEPLRIVGDRGEAVAANFALATMELIDASYRAAGLPPRPRTPLSGPS
jgi:hypothetical protein